MQVSDRQAPDFDVSGDSMQALMAKAQEMVQGGHGEQIVGRCVDC